MPFFAQCGVNVAVSLKFRVGNGLLLECFSVLFGAAILVLISARKSGKPLVKSDVGILSVVYFISQICFLMKY